MLSDKFSQTLKELTLILKLLQKLKRENIPQLILWGQHYPMEYRKYCSNIFEVWKENNCQSRTLYFF